MRLRLHLTYALVVLNFFLTVPVTGQTLDAVIGSVGKRFPSVRQLSTQEFSDWVANTNRPVPLLVDVRSADEFSISHLKNSRNLGSAAEVKSVAASTDQPVVVYCSVGYRSSALAEKLQKAGFINVRNLEGSIFKWANEGRPIFCGTNQVSVVHPFDAKWGKLLNRRFHPKHSPQPR